VLGKKEGQALNRRKHGLFREVFVSRHIKSINLVNEEERGRTKEGETQGGGTPRRRAD